ncbi:FAD-dependent oxidoreductase [Desulfobacterales bacterium HSG17]|nr:FAD-dependent oxidoreductase [Desulfobacterales bacterium HSG17]
MKKKLVLVGGGHAHLTVLQNLNSFTNPSLNPGFNPSFNQAIVISSNSFQYYSGMGPGMLSGIYTPEMIRFNIKKMVEDRGGVFIQDKVCKIDPEKKQLLLESENTVEYDIVSFNTGSMVPFDFPETYQNDFVFPVKPIENLLIARNRIIGDLKQKSLKIWVAGAGAAGVEIAANLCRLVKDNKGKAEIFLASGNGVMSGFDIKIRDCVIKVLNDLGVKIADKARIKSIEKNRVIFTDKSDFEADYVFLAVGTSPSSIFRDSGIPTGSDGGLLLDSFLRSVSYNEIFGGGDCISFAPFSLQRVGVYAVRQNPILFHNLQAALKSTDLKNTGDYQKFIPQKSFMQILNMGNRTGIFFRKPLVFSGRTAFLLKDYIDRTFMKKFQVSGEIA